MAVIVIVRTVYSSKYYYNYYNNKIIPELNLMDWSAGFRMAYCQQAAIFDLIDPFKDAIVKMTNRFCKNATACRLEKP